MLWEFLKEYVCVHLNSELDVCKHAENSWAKCEREDCPALRDWDEVE